MEDFSLRRDFKFVNWSATLWVNGMRAAFAGLAIGILYLVGVQETRESWWMVFLLPIAWPLFYLLGWAPIGLICKYLSERGVPYIGLYTLAITLLVIPGDPLVFLLWKYNKKLVPIDKYKFLEFSFFIFIINEEKKKTVLEAV